MKKQPIILVNPGVKPEKDALEKNRDTGIYICPFSLLFLQNYLLSNNIQSCIFDLCMQKPDELFEITKYAEKPIVGVTAQAHSVLMALDIIKQVKEINKNSIIVVGGNFFTNTHRDVLNRFKEVDVVVRGEGEITFYELVKAIQNNMGFDTIDGITYRNNGRIIENKNRQSERDIEKFALKYDTLPVTNRFKEGILLRNYEKENYRSFPVFLGRGCSRKCVFCEYNQFKYRVRKIPYILQEIDYLIRNYSAKYFSFADTSLCENKNFVKEFCEVLIEKYPHIKWSCEARVDTPLEVLELMAKAGCISVAFGLESGSENVLKAINKNIDLRQTYEFAKACHSLNIRSHMFLMVSLPGETENDAMQTIKVCDELSKYVTSMSISVTQILPGTELESIAYEKGILAKDFSYYDERFYHSHTQYCNPHIPLYFEHLNIDFIDSFFQKMMEIREQRFDNLSVLMGKVKTHILSLHKRPLQKNLDYFRRFILVVFRKIQSIFDIKFEKKLTRRSLSLIHISSKKYHRNFNNDKKRLIDHTFRKCSPVPVSFADLGGIWNIDGAYTFYTLKKYNPVHAFLVDTDFTDAAVKMSHSFSNLKLVKGNFGDMSVLATIGRVDVFYMFDVLLHQVNPDWNEILEMYSRQANYIVIFNPQWTGSGSTVRLLDMGKEEYFRNVPHTVDDPLYSSLFEKMNDYHPDHNRIWRDIHNVWQWGITDNDLSLKMKDLGFRMKLYKNFGRFGTLSNFENHGFVYQKL